MSGNTAFASDSGSVLAGFRASRAAAERVAVDRADLTVVWCERHAPSGDGEVERFGARWVRPAGPGSPEVDEASITELATALHLSTDSGHGYVGNVLEVRYRLPRLWGRVHEGRVPWWRAARIADTTIGLSQEAARFVDDRLADYAGSVSWAQLDRLVEEARHLTDPDAAEQETKDRLDRRRVEIDTTHPTLAGTVRIEGELDLPDARDVDAALSEIAAELAACGSTDSLDARRAAGLGELARRQTSLPISDNTAAEPTEEPVPTEEPAAPKKSAGPVVPMPAPSGSVAPPALRRRRDVQLHVHISADQLAGPCARCGHEAGGPLARVDSPHPTPVTVEAVRAWLAAPDTRITIRPVLDLADHIQTDAYCVPDRLREQLVQVSPACVFPFCTRPARRADIDHIDPFDEGGPTSSDNTAPLCRRHHRYKTHSGWRYQRLHAGTFAWFSPGGSVFLRDGTGTIDVTPPTPVPKPPDDKPPPF